MGEGYTGRAGLRRAVFLILNLSIILDRLLRLTVAGIPVAVGTEEGAEPHTLHDDRANAESGARRPGSRHWAAAFTGRRRRRGDLPVLFDRRLGTEGRSRGAPRERQKARTTV